MQSASSPNRASFAFELTETYARMKTGLTKRLEIEHNGKLSLRTRRLHAVTSTADHLFCRSADHLHEFAIF